MHEWFASEHHDATIFPSSSHYTLLPFLPFFHPQIVMRYRSLQRSLHTCGRVERGERGRACKRKVPTI